MFGSNLRGTNVSFPASSGAFLRASFAWARGICQKKKKARRVFEFAKVRWERTHVRFVEHPEFAEVNRVPGESLGVVPTDDEDGARRVSCYTLR